jgi:ribose/xylose/arabinose/galactoside ABC-type transport system permease subunit
VGEEEEHIHLPGPSWYPFTLAASLTVAMIGLVNAPHFGQSAGAGQWTISIVITVIGAIGMAWSIIAWGIEVSEA